MAQNISVPDIGDFKDVEVIEILVKPGDQIKKNDPVVTIESDKSSVEIPSPSEGKIKDLKVKIGDKVSEGSVLVTIENGQAVSPKKERTELKKENNFVNRTKNINSFLGEAKNRLHEEGCLVSADIFGFILTNIGCCYSQE